MTGSGEQLLLELDSLTVKHAQLTAVADVSLGVPAGSVFAVIGANGAGKSTLLGAIAGLHRPTRGRIILDGEDITRLSCPKRVERGVSLVPEGRRLFPSLTVEENILTGAYQTRPGQWNLSRIYEMFPWMPGRRRQSAAQLSGGEQHAVAIARALMANPRILLIDELSLGLAPIVVRGIYASLPALLESGLTVMLVEQDVALACSVASRIQCLLEGRTTLVGGPTEFSTAQIEAAYFGMAAGAPAGAVS
ncbi:MAG: ABC transporter ATP-binding protein [Candidatus Dormiibacterota bacterium]